MKDKDELERIFPDSEISLVREGEEEDFRYNHEFNQRIEELHAIFDLREVMSYESKEAEEPIIMGDVDAFRYGFTYPESEFRNFTKSTLTRILKNFVGFSSLTDLPITYRLIQLPADFDFVYNELVHSTVMFLTQLFDLEDVREQLRAYLSNPHTLKTKGLVPALEYLLTREPRITEAEKKVVRELLEYINE